MIYINMKPEDQKRCKDMVRFFCEEIGTDAENEILSRINEGKEVIIAAQNGSIIGAIGFYILDDKAIGDFFYVSPKYRNHMIGGKLHKEACKEIKRRGLKKMIVFVHEKRLNLYTKLGYQHKLHILEKEVEA